MKRATYQWDIGRYLYKLESIWVTLRDRKNIDVPHSVPEWLIAVNYKHKKNLEV